MKVQAVTHAYQTGMVLQDKLDKLWADITHWLADSLAEK